MNLPKKHVLFYQWHLTVRLVCGSVVYVSNDYLGNCCETPGVYSVFITAYKWDSFQILWSLFLPMVTKLFFFAYPVFIHHEWMLYNFKISLFGNSIASVILLHNFCTFLFSLGGVGVWISFFTELNRWNTRKVTKFGKKYVKIQYLTAIGVLHTFQSSTLFPRIISVNKYIFVIFTMSFLGETL